MVRREVKAVTEAPAQPKIKIYYSHAKILRNSKQEKDDIELLEKLGFEIVNPYHPKFSDFWEMEGIEFGKVLIDDCPAFAFRALPNSKLTAGVGKELTWAMEANRLIIELPFSVKDRAMSIDSTVDYYAQVGGK